MTRKPKVEEAPQPDPAADPPGTLEPDLKRTLKAVGPQQYAYATAHAFALGGKYNPRPKRRRLAEM